MKKDIFVPVLSLLIICIVSSALLGGVNMLTSDRIAQLAEQKVIEAQNELLPAQSYENADIEGNAYVTAVDADGNTVGYIFTTSANGYGGAIKLMTGVDTNGQITGISILEINETPGLGMKAKNDSFLQQFTGISGMAEYTKGAVADANTVQAITSATITTKAVTAAVNKALSLYDSVKEANANG